MTHMGPMSESEGTFTKEEEELYDCPKCHQKKVVCKIWESSDGGYEDYKYTCGGCGYSWWVDGIDS